MANPEPDTLRSMAGTIPRFGEGSIHTLSSPSTRGIDGPLPLIRGSFQGVDAPGLQTCGGSRATVSLHDGHPFQSPPTHRPRGVQSGDPGTGFVG